MDGDARHAAPRRQVDEREQVLIEPVHAPPADEPEQVERPAVRLHALAGVDEGRVLEERAVPHGLRDPHEVLHDHAAGAEVQVADLAVPHLPLRQPDGEPGRVEQRARAARPQGVPGRRFGQRDGVPVARGTVTPAVEDEQGDGAGVERGHHGRAVRNRGADGNGRAGRKRETYPGGGVGARGHGHLTGGRRGG
jgi:hypothetical protein